MNRYIAPSELPINSDGSVFHLHLKPEHLAKRIIMVGDPARVNVVASKFDQGSIICDIQNREYHTITGTYKGIPVTCLSHGIGNGNIDIVMTELDALVNVDLNERTELSELTQLTIVRLGTSGSLQDDVPVGSFVCSDRSIGFDGLLNYYLTEKDTLDLDYENEFCKHTNYHERFARPYVVKADEKLAEVIGEGMVHGTTISAPGFYAPQGRYVRKSPLQADLNSLIRSFSYKDTRICNMEMESAPVAGLAKLFGHRAVTVCDIIAGRTTGKMNTSYHGGIEELISLVLERIIKVD